MHLDTYNDALISLNKRTISLHGCNTTLTHEIQTKSIILILFVRYNNLTWTMDIGATFHMTPYRSFSMSHKAGEFGSVGMGSFGESRIDGIGSVCLKSKLVVFATQECESCSRVENESLVCRSVLCERYTSLFIKGKWKLYK